jgi:hypothetical protein
MRGEISTDASHGREWRMDQGIGMLVLVIVVGTSLVALFAVMGVLFTRTLERTRAAVEELPARSFLIGLVNVLFLLAIILGLGALRNSMGPSYLDLLVVLILALLAVGIAVGLAALVQVVGERLLPDRSSLAQRIWGAVALVLACLTPYVGWFGLLPYLALTGLGAFILGWLGGRASKVEGLPGSKAEEVA